jgi:hypothetical protein
MCRVNCRDVKVLNKIRQTPLPAAVRFTCKIKVLNWYAVLHWAIAKTIKLLVCENISELNYIACHIFYNFHQFNEYLSFGSLIIICCDALHTKWVFGWSISCCSNRPSELQAIYIARRYRRKVAFDMRRLSLSDSFKSDLSLLFRCERFTPNCIFFCKQRVSRIACCILLVAST